MNQKQKNAAAEEESVAAFLLPAACHARAGGCTGIGAGSVRAAGAAGRGSRGRAGRAGAGVGVVGSVVRALSLIHI